MKDNIIYDVEIKTPKFQLKHFGLTEKEAREKCELVLKDNPDDEIIQTELAHVMTGFGFMGHFEDGYGFQISGRVPRESTGEKQTCGRRSSDFLVRDRTEGIDEWIKIGDDRVCSYCGSLHPERVLELIITHGFGIIEKTTKDYKWYVNREEVSNAALGGIKFYLQHNTPEFVSKFNKLVDLNKRS